MTAALTRSDLEYLERLVRREIRRKETDLRGDNRYLSADAPHFKEGW